MAPGSTRDAWSDQPPPSSLEKLPSAGSSSDAAASPFPSLPSVSLPKGGGAIRGIGEKFDAHPTTGTGSMHLPVPTSPGRSGFGPQLSLAYDSGTGNGPFGLGWSLSLPSITRKTDKGLPQYRDDIESDVFILSGAEDLVPVLSMENGRWGGENLPLRTIDGVEYRVQRYRPRIEGPFSRIERWTSLSDPAGVSWRSISQENVTTWYGKTAASRIADPANPQRIFRWLICESSDDKGNVMVHEYKREDAAGVPMTQANESNRMRTANLYPKHIRYGNRAPYLPVVEAPPSAPPNGDNWYFDVVFDYGEHDPANPSPDDELQWPVRNDPFSSYRSGFEIRTYRLCQRILMFHNFPGEPEVGSNCLVHSTDLTYSYEANPADARNPIFSAILAVTHTGYRRNGARGYLSSSLPPVEFTYSEARIQNQVRDFDLESLVNLPQGVDGTHYQWADLDGEGTSGILTEQAGAWFYKRNQSPLSMVNNGLDGTMHYEAKFGPMELLPDKPGLAFNSPIPLLDLAGDGRPNAVQFDDPAPGFFTRTDEGQWDPFTTFRCLPNVDWSDPNLKFVDLNGDGLADVLITEGEALTWYPSLGRNGFGPAERVGNTSWDEERAPVVVFADGEQSVYLADMSGDGLSDLVRIRNGDVCYWPNLGYGRFGAKVAMDNAPWFDHPDQFNQLRIRLGDIDGSGTTDILYLHAKGVRAYFNRSGNGWSAPTILDMCPVPDSVTGVQVVDLLGNGTACIVWSSPLATHARQTIRYLDLMRGQKPHLLVSSRNNLGAETRVQYAPSTKFYLADKLIGKPWATKLPFPVHVVERVETYDQISHTHFVTRYAYHHGYFDAAEREFRGFGMVEQWDTEEVDELKTSTSFSDATNLAAASHIPPVLTRTWFHTGAFLKGQQISRQFAREYYHEDGLTDAQLAAESLDDTILPTDVLHADGTRSAHNLETAEMLEACRALKGAMLRREIYALDRTEAAARPYTVSEQNHTVELLQVRAEGNRHAVFLVHPRETLDFQYERVVVVNAAGQQRADPRVSHSVNLLVDAFGNALRTLAISYPRRALLTGTPPAEQQAATHITLTVNRFANQAGELDWYRVNLPVETRSYEMVKPVIPLVTSAQTIAPLRFHELAALIQGLFPLHQDEPASEKTWPYEYWDWRTNSGHAPSETRLRLIEHTRVLYRRDDLKGPLPLGHIESMALPYESYELAFTQGLLAGVLQRSRDGQPPESLLPDLATVLTNKGGDQGGYVALDRNGWWLPSGRFAYAPTADFANPAATSVEELAEARAHFFLLRKHCDPFGQSSAVSYSYDLVVAQMQDAVGNTTSAVHDYRVLQPSLVTDANGNRTAVAFDALGMVTATAIMGPAEQESGLLQPFILDPRGQAASLLGRATTRIVYDLNRFRRAGQPPFAASLARETHVGMLQPGQASKIHINFTYSDGFGRKIQTKKLGEQGTAPQRLPPVVLPSGDIGPGSLMLDANGHPVEVSTASRWVGDGRTVYNNKGKPVRQYEPFFSSTHLYEDEAEMTDTGVSSVLFYDPLERVVGILHPNHTWEKVVFDPWQHAIWDVNDTLLVADPKEDPHVGVFFRRLHDTDFLPTWHARRQDGALGSQEQDAARKAAIHAATPTIVHADSLGRTFLTVAHNKFKYADASPSDLPTEEFYHEQTVLDIEGNHRKAVDANGRTVMQYDYDMLGNRIHQASMEAGERWILRDAAGNPIRTWDSRGHMFRAEYDALRRPIRSLVTGADDTDPAREVLTERLVYGEQHPEDNALLNMRGKLFLHFDQAGVVAHEAYDFKGNPLASSRRLAKQYKGLVMWSAVDAVLPPTNSTARIDNSRLEATLVPVLETGKHINRRTCDALNRPITLSVPDDSVIRSGYNEAGLLDQLHVNLQATLQPDGQPVWTPFVTNIEYDAKGQRQLIDYGNGIGTTYAYDPLTFRLVHMVSRRNADALTDLLYTYDPVGNITHIRDDAQQTLYFRNKRVEPSADYTYDATYRLIEATGREHLGQVGAAPTPSSHNDDPRVGVPFSASDGNAMARYLERYVYDMVGNFQKVIHRGSDGAVSGWTRSYVYNEPSQLEPGRKSNRLTSTTTGTATENYRYDGRAGLHGNITSMPHLSLMQWNHHDQLEATSAQTTSNGNVPEITWYVYDAGGQRVRKVTERQATAADGETAATLTRKAERIYLGGGLFELYRKYGGNGESVTLERSTLHIADDKRRVALVETRTQGEEAGLPARSTRYQLSNHLGSSTLELDGTAQIISYEEYTPFGSTSYQMVQSETEISKKRYRYTGKERDKETGFYYHGARYYAPWLGRWTSPDPAGLVDGVNLYAYVQNSPLTMSDPTGLWGWREVAVIAAVVVVGTVVSVATAGAAAPLAAAAVASVGLTGTAATVATGVAVGAVAGAVGGAAAGAAGEGTRQVVHGESLDAGRILSEAGSGAAVGGAIGAAIPLAGAAAGAAAGTATGAAVVGAVNRIGQQAAQSGAARALVAGGKAVAQQPGVRHAIQGTRSVAQATSRGLQAVESGGRSVGNRLLSAGGQARPPAVPTAVGEAPAPTSPAPPSPAAAEAPVPMSGDVPYNPRSIREALENRYGAANVQSTTVPPANAKNARLAGRAHSQGTVMDVRGYPIFDDIAAADLRLSGSQVRSLSYKGQMRASTQKLRDLLQTNPALRSRFTPKQLRAIQAGKPNIPGLTWHHHQDLGRMQLVPTSVHKKVGHIGGDAMWSGK
ncbi:RHS repeat-associated core domain protein [Chaetomium sp. MPI-CAGE-AT-0009]|nr:RHS repeat-associated core domain protein [Chaetomium sp. MPI-CAGE-AT-0009]